MLPTRSNWHSLRQHRGFALNPPAEVLMLAITKFVILLLATPRCICTKIVFTRFCANLIHQSSPHISTTVVPGAVEAFARRNPGSGRLGDNSRHKSLADSFGSSTEAVVDSERTRTISRNRSSAKMPTAAAAATPSSRGTSSKGDGGEQNRAGRWVSSGSGSNRPSPAAAQRHHHHHHHSAAADDRSPPAAKGGTAIRCFERLSIGGERRK